MPEALSMDMASTAAPAGLWTLLREDLACVFQRDPAARSKLEVLATYPGVHALLVHRMSHRLWRREWRFVARLLSFLGRTLTNIDIHPGARIGRRMFIDHGAGVVIGETAHVGDDVTLYHGVTLGGTSWNRGKRHPPRASANAATVRPATCAANTNQRTETTMDLLDFSDCTLYFEEPLPAAAENLLTQAARDPGQPGAEMALLRACLLVPDKLTVLVGLYRYYFYQRRLEDALLVAERAMQLAGHQLGLPPDWHALDETWLGSAAANSFGLLRFYLLARKAASLVLLRLGRSAESRARLCKLAALDNRDQFGAARLLAVVDAFEQAAEPHLTPAPA